MQSHGRVVEEVLDIFIALQLAVEHRIADRQVEMGMCVNPRSLHARADLRTDIGEGMLFRGEQNEAPYGRVDNLAVGEGIPEIARDGAQSLRHLPLAVERAALHVVVDPDGKREERPPVIELLQIGHCCRVAQSSRPAVQEDAGVLEREVLDEDAQHVEGVHDEVGRGVHAHDVADAEHEPRPNQRELLDARPREAPQADDGQRDHDQ